MILKLLREIDERSNKEEKTIIFSQFTSMLDLIEPFLKDKGIAYVRCECSLCVNPSVTDWRRIDDGQMSKVQRDESLEKIRTSKRTRCILISFKAGSTGETCAQKC
jgi:SNF2 family DNA or RNA helicase